MKKNTIILHVRTKNYDHMMYGSWNMVCNGRTDSQIDGQTDGWTDKWTDGQREQANNDQCRQIMASGTGLQIITSDQ